ncbi:MAG: hypothetical protein ACI81R_001436 [Bradymonadia bacterium]|jgi:hypothetical protein
MSSTLAQRLQGELSSLLVAHYAELPTGVLYQVCAEAVGRRGSPSGPIPAGPPRSKDEAMIVAHLRAVLDGLLQHRFADLSDRDANAAIAGSLQHVDRLVRASGSRPIVEAPSETVPPNAFDTPGPSSFARVPSSRSASGESRRSTASIPSFKNSRGAERTNTKHSALASRASAAPRAASKNVSGSASARSKTSLMQAAGPPPPTRTATWVRGVTTDFGLLWAPDKQTAELEVEDHAALDLLAFEIREAGELVLPLDPPPQDASAVLLRVGVRGGRHHNVPGAASVGGSVRVVIAELPEALRVCAHRAFAERASASQTGTHRVIAQAQPDATPTAFMSPPRSSTGHRTVPRSPSSSELIADTKTEEELIDARRRRAHERRTGARGNARNAANDQLRAIASARTPTAGTATVLSDETAADRVAKRRAVAAARRADRGQAPAMPKTYAPQHAPGTPPPAASDELLERWPFEDTGQRRSAPQPVVASAPRPDLHDRHSSATHKTVPAAPPVDESRDRRDRTWSSAGFAAVDSWSRVPTPSSVRKRILNDSPEFGEELGVEESVEEFSSPACVLLRVAAKWPSALVQIATLEGEWSLLVREDQVLDIQQQPEAKSFEVYHLIQESGLASGEALSAAETAAEANQHSLLDQLVADGTLRFREVEALRTARLRLMLESLLHDPSDHWRAQGYQSVGLADAPPIIFARRAWEHHVAEISAMPPSEVEAMIEAFGSERPRFVDQARLTAHSLGLEGRERRLVVELLTGELTCAQLLTQSPLRPPATRAIVAALDSIGLLDWQSTDVTARRVARSYETVTARLEMLGGDPFELLESHWSCDDKLLRDSLRRLQRMLDLSFISEHGTSEQKAIAKAVSAGLDVAWRSLSTREQRVSVRRKIAQPFELRSARALYRKKAEIALMRNDTSTAEDALRRMLELEPSDDETRNQLRIVLSQ